MVVFLSKLVSAKSFLLTSHSSGPADAGRLTPALAKIIGKHVIFYLRKYFWTAVCSLLCSCVVVPKKVEYYDDDCRIVTKKYELTTEQYSVLGNINQCSNEECVAEVTGAVFGAVVMVPFSAVVSGSIVVVGNTVYWLEKQGNCNPV